MERLSCGSSRFPLLTVSKNGIEDGEQLTHACGENELGWLAGGAHPLIHGPDDRVSAGSDERCHIESRTDRGAPTPDGSPTFHDPTIAAEGRETSQRRDLPAIQSAELWQFGKQRPGGGRADTRDGGQQLFGCTPCRAALDGVIQIAIQPLQFGPKPRQVSVNSVADVVPRLARPVAFRRYHIDDLSTTRDEIGEGSGIRVWEGPDLWPHTFAKQGDNPRVKPVRLRDLSSGPSEVADLAWVNDHDGQARYGQGCCDRNLVSPDASSTTRTGDRAASCCETLTTSSS